MDIRNFFKNSVVSSSEVRVNDDIRETHTAEDNAAQVLQPLLYFVFNYYQLFLLGANKNKLLLLLSYWN